MRLRRWEVYYTAPVFEDEPQMPHFFWTKRGAESSARWNRLFQLLYPKQGVTWHVRRRA